MDPATVSNVLGTWGYPALLLLLMVFALFNEKKPQIYALYYQTGRRDYRRAGDKEGVLTTYDAETFSGPDCLTVVGWYRRALEMCGAKNVRVVEEECRAAGGVVCRVRPHRHTSIPRPMAPA